MSSAKSTKSGRVVIVPKRFVDEIFVKGSGIVGCDSYDHKYDKGGLENTEKDLFQGRMDIKYERDLQTAMNVQVATQNLPFDIELLVQNATAKKSFFTSDIEFIAPDDTPPEKTASSEEEEDVWESGEETEEDGWDEDCDWD